MALFPGLARTRPGKRTRSLRVRFVAGSVRERIFHCCSFKKLTPSGASGMSA